MRYLLNIIFFILCFLCALPTEATDIKSFTTTASQKTIISAEALGEHYIVVPQNSECEITSANNNKNNFSGNDRINSSIQIALSNKTPNVDEKHSNVDTIHIIKSYLKNEVCTRAP